MQVGILHKNCAAQQASAWILHSCTSCVTCEKGLLPGVQAHSLKKTHFSCVDYLPIPATGAKPTRSERLLPVEPGQHSATNRCKLENVETKWVQSARNACQCMLNRKRSFHTITRCCALRPVVLVLRLSPKLQWACHSCRDQPGQQSTKDGVEHTLGMHFRENRELVRTHCCFVLIPYKV